MRLGRLQRQSRRAFWASAASEVSTSELAGWCWARQTLMEKRAPSRWHRSDDPRWPSPLHWAAATPASKGRSPDNRLMVDWPHAVRPREIGLYLALRETLHSLLPLMRGQSTGTTNLTPRAAVRGVPHFAPLAATPRRRLRRRKGG